jgi:hypothetical protein
LFFFLGTQSSILGTETPQQVNSLRLFDFYDKIKSILFI